MDLQLAVTLSCTKTGCQVQFLSSDARIDARYSEPMVDNEITVKPGDLVAVDTSITPPRVVFRWLHSQVGRAEGGHSLTVDGRPVHPDHLRAESFPRIRAMCQRLEALNDLDPRQVVEEGYDCIAERYLEWAQDGRAEERRRYTSVLVDNLPRGAEVLDLGCGAGVPTTRELAQHFLVTGVDISARQIALARQNVPEARFIQADMTRLDFPPGSFDAVATFYSLIHVPREEEPKLLGNIASWLRSRGLLVATMGAHSLRADLGDDYLGALMYWSHFDASTNRRNVEEAGLRIVSAREETAIEFDKPVTFLWVIAEKPGSRQDGE